MMSELRADVSDEEMKQIVARLDRQRRIQITGLAVVVVAAFMALVSRVVPAAALGLPFSFWGLLAVSLLLAKLVLLFAGWRCPKCGAMLGSYWPRYCSGCGMAFRDREKR